MPHCLGTPLPYDIRVQFMIADHKEISLVPRPLLPVACSTVKRTVLQATGSCARAWERGYKEIESHLAASNPTVL